MLTAANPYRFKPGMSGNPGGKPAGARNRLTTAFVHALADDFDKHGRSTIEQCRITDPGKYLHIVASLLPKEIETKLPLEGLDDAQLIESIHAIERYMAERAIDERVDAPIQ